MSGFDERITALESWKADIVGPHAKNGRLGRLETRQSVTERQIKWAAGLLVSIALGFAGSAYTVVQRMNDRAREAGQADERERQQQLRLDRVEGFLLGLGMSHLGVDP